MSSDTLTQYSPSDSLEDWVTNFNVQIVFDPLTTTKTEFCQIQPLPPLGGRRQKHASKHNWAPVYLTMKKLQLERLDVNNKNLFSNVLQFSILRGGKREKRLISKIRIFEHNLLLNYSMVKKFRIRKLNFHTKNPFQ